ncbi:MAG: creatininase family protein [Ruminococcaceae bacterium]|nr:creatininase family protein [Oscillospiraceae bacterium]
MLSYRNTAEEISGSSIDTVILPLGSVEQHSSHLPIGTDALMGDALGKAVAEKLNALLLPTLPISNCYEHKGTKGTVWIKPHTYYKMLEDIILCLQEQGFHKVVLLLCHGGIFVAGPVVRELNALHDDLQVIKYDVTWTPEIREVMDDKGVEIHAGEAETSLMLYLYEDLVNKERMMHNDAVPDVPQSFLNYAPLPQLSPTGAWGKPSLASREKGGRIFELLVEDAVKYIEKAFAVSSPKAW